MCTSGDEVISEQREMNRFSQEHNISPGPGIDIIIFRLLCHTLNARPCALTFHRLDKHKRLAPYTIIKLGDRLTDGIRKTRQ